MFAGKELDGLPTHRRTDLRDDRAQAMLRAFSGNFFKTKLDEKYREEHLKRELESITTHKRKTSARMTRHIKDTREQAESLAKDKMRAFNTRMRREAAQTAKKPFHLYTSLSPTPQRARMLDAQQTFETSRSFHVQSDPVPVHYDSRDKCRFVTRKGQCADFPCIPCGTYNRMGYFLNENTRELNERIRGLTPTSHEMFWEEIERTSPLRPLHQPFNRAAKQERSLNKMMRHMRRKQEKTKPKEWVVKYGDPTPLRKILNPARA